MAFFTLGGWDLKALDGSVTASTDPHGDLGPRFTNRPSRTRRGLPRMWTLTVPFARNEIADTLEGLGEGQGHHFPCETDAWSESGHGPEEAKAGNYSLDAGGVFGAFHLNISGASLTWDLGLPTDDFPSPPTGRWTIMYWENVAVSPQHIAIRADGARWVNGIRNDAATDILTSDAPAGPLTVGLGAISLLTGTYDDIVALPFNAAGSMISAYFAWGQAFHPLPRLTLEGDIVSGETVTVLSNATDQDYVQHGSSTSVSGWRNDSRSVVLKLEEVL